MSLRPKRFGERKKGRREGVSTPEKIRGKEKGEERSSYMGLDYKVDTVWRDL